MKDDLPIDIHSSKLLDWLISRRHCNKEWLKNVFPIREKVKNAILDMPESEEIFELLQGSCITYFHCVRIIEILKETEKDTKNFLGYYSSQRMTHWQEIESLYRKDNVYLAEAAQYLQRLAQFEIPALKRQVTKHDQSVTDAAKKFVDYGKQAEDSKKLYQNELNRMGLKGESLRAELLGLAADLPTFLDEITQQIRNLSNAKNHYESFRNYMHQNNAPKTEILPAIKLIIEKGVNATAYEFNYGHAPDKIEEPNFDLLLTADSKKSESDDDEIDFGDEIDFANGDSEIAEIDFGNDIQIDVVADDTGVVGEKIASGPDALGLLENGATHKVVKQELNELLAFLTTRLEDEIRETSSDALIRGAERRPDDISKISIKNIEEWIKIAENILESLNDSQKMHLFKIRGSPQYVKRIVEELEMKRDLEEKYNQLQKLMTEKEEKAREMVAKATDNLKTVVENTKKLQKQVEEEISKKYNGRKVNIMGGINQALAGV